MGFIERLRRQKELEKSLFEDKRRLDLERNAEDVAKNAKLERDALDREIEERERARLDIEKAKEFFGKSDFIKLAYDLKSIISDMAILDGVIDGHVRDIDKNSLGLVTSEEYYSLNRISPVGISLIWNEMETPRHEESLRNWGSYLKTNYTIWSESFNFISIGCNASGEITLWKSWGNIRLKPSRWLGDSEIQEKSLGKAYSNPKIATIRFGHDNSPPSSPPVQL